MKIWLLSLALSSAALSFASAEVRFPKLLTMRSCSAERPIHL